VISGITIATILIVGLAVAIVAIIMYDSSIIFGSKIDSSKTLKEVTGRNTTTFGEDLITAGKSIAETGSEIVNKN
jgi:hypothetical protein